MLEKEEMIIRLKSDLQLNKKKLQEAGERFEKDKATMEKKIRKEVQKEFRGHIEEYQNECGRLRSEVQLKEDTLKEKDEELEHLRAEHARYRQESKRMLDEKGMLITELEEKLKSADETHAAQTSSLRKENELLQNDLNVIGNEVKIGRLKITFFSTKLVRVTCSLTL